MIFLIQKQQHENSDPRKSQNVSSPQSLCAFHKLTTAKMDILSGQMCDTDRFHGVMWQPTYTCYSFQYL